MIVYSTIKIGKGLGTKAMEDMLMYNREMRKF